MDEITVPIPRPMPPAGIGPLIALARELRGLAQGALAEAIGVPQSRLHRYENGMASPRMEDVEAICAHLMLPASFFTQPSTLVTEPCWRRHQGMSVRDRKRIIAMGCRIRATIARFLDSVDIQPALPWRTFDPADYDGNDTDIGELIAAEVRVLWSIPPGPIRNLMQYVEAAGILVQSVAFLSEQVDALTWPTCEPRFILLAADRPGCRRRLSLAHELGHHVMGHLTEHTRTDAQAKAFAAALLLPVDDFVHTWPSILTIETLGQLKMHWGVSMQAILYRARKLQIIDERVYQNWAVHFTRNGWRKAEPVHIGIENPSLVPEVLQAMTSSLELTIDELAGSYGWNPGEFRDAIGSEITEPRVIRTSRPVPEHAASPGGAENPSENILTMPDRHHSQ
jgi:Zn-dependent peptidase ImmA (M78 family)/transcriptional regulator with XRE-family HTH domain